MTESYVGSIKGHDVIDVDIVWKASIVLEHTLIILYLSLTVQKAW